MTLFPIVSLTYLGRFPNEFSLLSFGKSYVLKKNKVFPSNVKMLLFYRIINVYVLFTATEKDDFKDSKRAVKS